MERPGHKPPQVDRQRLFSHQGGWSSQRLGMELQVARTARRLRPINVGDAVCINNIGSQRIIYANDAVRPPVAAPTLTENSK